MPLPENPPTGKLPFEPPAQSSPDLEEFWELWRAEKFWACHEALEEVWRAETQVSRRPFLQGLIHCAVALFQYRRGNFVGAARQLVRARVRLTNSLPLRENVDLKALLAGIEEEIAPAFRHLTARDQESLGILEARLRREILC